MILSAINPRLKLFAGGVLTGIALLTGNLYVLSLLLLAVIALCGLANVRARTMTHALITVVPFVLFSIGSGQTHDSSALLIHLVVVVTRITVLSLIALLTTAIVNHEEIVHSLMSFLQPLRFVGIDPGQIGAVLSLGLQQAPAIAEEARSLLLERFRGSRISIRTAHKELGEFLGELILIGLSRSVGQTKSSSISNSIDCSSARSGARDLNHHVIGNAD